ncbi:hypothetical protein MHA01_00550 [Marinococcus halophilus]|uniref:Uncharacterized protein n=1 Tax=Marinococcus halophilus TaxID=1371 RepID=A0A510Y1G7_MARHA|nr:hypothetical protein MHA01_00550 [Marinococcus halophilus]
MECPNSSIDNNCGELTTDIRKGIEVGNSNGDFICVNMKATFCLNCLYIESVEEY